MEQVAYLGENTIDKLETIFSKILPKRVFLVRGKKSYITSGAKEQIEKFLTPEIQVTDFFDFQENPKIEDLENGLKLLESFKPDLIIAIGGGSVLDMAKLIRFCHSYDGNPTGKVFDKKRVLIPLVAIPTTAGTGSESTHFSVIYKDNIKYSLEHDDILPDYTIVYAPFTYNNPKYLTACTGFDALAQAIEAYWNVNATEESDRYAMKAIVLVYPNLPIVVNNPTKEVRDKVSEGSYWAGKAINITRTTAPHAFSYFFTSNYGYPHGHAVAMSFPYFWNSNVLLQKNLSSKVNKDQYLDKMLELRKLIDRDIYIYISEIGLSLLLPDNFQIKDVIAKININRLLNNPVIVNESDYVNIFDIWRQK